MINIALGRGEVDHEGLADFAWGERRGGCGGRSERLPLLYGQYSQNTLFLPWFNGSSVPLSRFQNFHFHFPPFLNGSPHTHPSPSTTQHPTTLSQPPPPPSIPPFPQPQAPLSIPQTPGFVQSQTPFPLSKTPRFRVMSANSLRLGMGWYMGT